MNINISGINKINIGYARSVAKSVPFRADNNKTDKLERSPKQDTYEISIGYINDTHGQTNNMMRILSGLKGDLNLSAGDNDIGDEKNKPVHKLTYKFLNIANIKASAIGNHELDTTQEDLIDSLNDYEGDILAVNIDKDMIEEQSQDDVKKLGRAHLENSWKPYKIVDVKGEKIGLLGASPSDMLDRLTHPNYHTDCHINELDESIIDIQKVVDELKKQGVNKIVLLSHMGFEKDKETAQKTDGIDVIIGGHTHELVRDIKEGDNLLYSKSGEPVVITQAGRDGNYFGQLNLEFDGDGVITKAQNNLGKTGLFHKNLVNQYIFDDILGKAEKIGHIKQAPPAPTSLIEENPHANFVCDVMKEKTDSDIGLWHLCGVRNHFHEGDIDSRDIKDISPFLDYVVTANVSEKTLVDTFNDAIKTTFESPSYKPGLFATSGLEYKVDAKNGKLAGMTFIDKEGVKHDIDVENPREDKFYKVVTDEFLMSAGADFKVLAKEEDCLKKYPYDKDVMVCEYIKEKGEPVVIDQYNRFSFVENS